jgi:copper transport protein
MRKRPLLFLWIGVPLLLGAWTVRHIEVRESLPKENQVLAESPQEIWVKFNVPPDTSQSTFTVRGPAGSVALDTIRWDPEVDPTVLRAKVEGQVPEGDYIISWIAAPIDDHGGRGRIPFSISGG